MARKNTMNIHFPLSISTMEKLSSSVFFFFSLYFQLNLSHIALSSRDRRYPTRKKNIDEYIHIYILDPVCMM